MARSKDGKHAKERTTGSGNAARVRGRGRGGVATRRDISRSPRGDADRERTIAAPQHAGRTARAPRGGDVKRLDAETQIQVLDGATARDRETHDGPQVDAATAGTVSRLDEKATRGREVSAPACPACDSGGKFETHSDDCPQERTYRAFVRAMARAIAADIRAERG